jgi:hypothetical protein
MNGSQHVTSTATLWHIAMPGADAVDHCKLPDEIASVGDYP